jgi:prepilin-type N-terminal cleavage/methylation domain-containing protein
MNNRRDGHNGFTLIEIVIAISITAMVIATAYSALNQILNAKRYLDDKRDVSLTAYAIIQRITREFQLTVADIPLLFENNNSGEQQNNNSIFLLAESNGSGGSGHQDSITFIAQEGGQYLPDGGTHSGLVQITYKVAKDPEKESSDKVYSLIREEIPYATMPSSNNTQDWEKAKNKAFKNRMVFPVTDNIVSFRLTYYDKESEKWLKEWDSSRKGRVPAMISFNISLLSPLGNTEEYYTIVPIGAGNRNSI